MPVAKMPGHEPLPPKLEAVLVRIAQRCERLNNTRAAKLPYLVDVVANHVLGEPITEGSHQTWEHGVVTAEAWRHLDRAGSGHLFRVDPVPWSEEKRGSALSPEEEAIVDAVLAEYGNISATDLGLVTKRMNPRIPSWGANHRADIGEDAYDRLSWEYQEMVDIAARWRPGGEGEE